MAERTNATPASRPRSRILIVTLVAGAMLLGVAGVQAPRIYRAYAWHSVQQLAGVDLDSARAADARAVAQTARSLWPEVGIGEDAKFRFIASFPAADAFVLIFVDGRGEVQSFVVSANGTQLSHDTQLLDGWPSSARGRRVRFSVETYRGVDLIRIDKAEGDGPTQYLKYCALVDNRLGVVRRESRQGPQPGILVAMFPDPPLARGRDYTGWLDALRGDWPTRLEALTWLLSTVPHPSETIWSSVTRSSNNDYEVMNELRSSVEVRVVVSALCGDPDPWTAETARLVLERLDG